MSTSHLCNICRLKAAWQELSKNIVVIIKYRISQRKCSCYLILSEYFLSCDGIDGFILYFFETALKLLLTSFWDGVWVFCCLEVVGYFPFFFFFLFCPVYIHRQIR